MADTVPNHISGRTVIWRLSGYVLRYKAHLVLAFALAVLAVAAQLAKPWPLQIVVDYGLGHHQMPAQLSALFAHLPGGGSQSAIVFWAVILGIVIALLSSILAILSIYTVVGLGQRLVYDLSRDTFQRLQALSLTYHARYKVGDLLQRTTDDVSSVNMAVSQVALPGTLSLLGLLGMIAIMLHIDVVLTLVTLSAIPLLGVAVVFLGPPMHRTSKRQWEEHASLLALIEQSLSAIKAVQGFARERFIQGRVEAQYWNTTEAQADTTRASTAFEQATAAITAGVGAVVLGMGAMRVIGHHLTTGDLLVVLGYLAGLLAPVGGLAMAFSTAVQVITRGRRVLEVLDAQEDVPERPNAIHLPSVRGEVVFESVGFGYGDRPVLDDISFAALPGQVIAIVGATGAGKTSLVSLLSRFYDPWAGRILIDRHDIRDLSLSSLRRNVSLVLQEPFLFPMSVADNIAFGAEGISRDQIVAAAQAARAHDFIERLPQGYDTVLGERGATLSGGERQRISIARALLTDAPILILDEPTSSLDARTEAQIFDAITELIGNKTTFIISHRLSTIRRADQILAIENGHIAERGTHESLLALENVYARLYKHQHLAAV